MAMQQKLFYAFSMPMVICCIIVAVICGLISSRTYSQQTRNTINQAAVQASDFVGNHIQNMRYISELMSENVEIHEILSDPAYGKSSDQAQAYREFYRFSNVLRELKADNDSYLIGIYVPDDLYYAHNNYYFYSEEDLQAQAFYEELVQQLETTGYYFSVMQEPSAQASRTETAYLVLFSAIHITNAREERQYITQVALPLTELERIVSRVTDTIPGTRSCLTKDQETVIMSTFEEPISDLSALYQYGSNWSEFRLGNSTYYLVSEEIARFAGRLIFLVPYSWVFVQQWLMTALMFGLVIAIGAAGVVTSRWVSGYYGRRLTVLQDRMKDIGRGDLYTEIPVDRSVRGDELDEIERNFNHMAGELTSLMKAHYRLGKEAMSAELKALQAQINPHFLYNTLDLINWGALEHGADDVAAMARDLGRFYRLSLNHGKAAVLIEDELEHVEAYFRIEERHFPGALFLDIHVPEEIRQYACMNITLQPFVENAIIHGIAEHADIIDSRICIDAEREGNDIVFRVTDDGPGIPPEILPQILGDPTQSTEGGYGVKNINFRLKLCYGDAYGVSYESEEGIGTQVSIRIPAMTLEELEQSLQ